MNKSEIIAQAKIAEEWKEGETSPTRTTLHILEELDTYLNSRPVITITKGEV